MIMTKATRKPQIKHGTVKRLAGGSVVMDFIEEITDEGAPEFAVTGIASIERISAGQVRLTKYSRRRDGNVVVFHEVWDFETLKRSQNMYAKALAEIDRVWRGDGPEDGRRREAH